ncbi:MAG: tRNA uridine(34) 5-carboxymethylaminomethyl modification radical SAM/GNAT enzyme Elp3 [Candidatus Iainarchaeum archaeon]|uniref:Elongator complex protein 3 n=1 Tax=Candidatus Iainarchaeum sp. TaxID=3101447 RepID=A0A7T9DK32_9ARCH|nr:MAG: tRNA uridine(34) 5-carboxymethylaminomethyl modification radical SAM/GNAT enzyme Elp3 [Candidatus Diapherotrites archaeon]
MSQTLQVLAERLYGEIQAGKIQTPKQLDVRKRQLSEGLQLQNLPTNPDLLPIIQQACGPLSQEQQQLFSIKPVRNLSGVAVLAAMVKPHTCPHGTCVYCPKGIHHPAPPAYTGDEPAAQRGYRNNFDSFLQVTSRIKQLQATGQSTEKCELIIMGGTFLSMPEDYQYEFMQGCLDGISGQRHTTIQESVAACETSPNRVIGITMETRPDVAKLSDIQRMLTWGSTRVEMGVQSVYDDVLQKLNRQHTVQTTIDSTQRLKDSCLKVGYHMMSKLPHSTIERDLAAHLEIFTNPAFRPDMIKFYPLAVVQNTGVYQMWKRGEYEEMSMEEAIRFYSKLKPQIPEWVRVMRVQRDIPSQNISAGVKKTNLRQEVQRHMKELGIKCRCIRCREVGFKHQNEGVWPVKVELVTRAYEASQGKEYFISAEDVEQDILLGFTRLRIPHQPTLPELEDSAYIRELHVYGQSIPIGEQKEKSSQHKGWGKKLLAEAERIAKEEHGLDAMNIIAGIGVREYYKKLGYTQNGAFVKKELR